MAVEIISREIIKPAKMPLDDLKTFKISLLDNLSPEIYTPITLFYPMNETQGHFNKEDTTVRLKLSLSETLARFPMLAGRIKGDLIHCSDEGVGAVFVDATVKATMADFLKTPDLQLIAQFVPFPLFLNEPLETIVQVAVQVNYFLCGGIAIGFSFFHKLIDGTTMSAFITSWAASNEGTSEKLVYGSYSSASSLFPGRKISAHYNLEPSKNPFIVQRGKSSTTRRFVFDAVAISNLKARAKSASVLNPTSIEVVTCFIWKCAMKASRSCRSLDRKGLEGLVASGQGPSFVDPKWESVLVHIVDMRRRIQPSLSKYEVGNILWNCPTYYKASNIDTELVDLESILRQSLSKINNDFVQTVIGDDGSETLLNLIQQLNELYAKSSELYLFSSWCNMGFNEVNFGWGKPIWNALGKVFDSTLRNVITLMETTVGKGIEAWIVLDDETMNLLENDDESFSSLLLPIQASHWLESKRYSKGV